MNPENQNQNPNPQQPNGQPINPQSPAQSYPSNNSQPVNSPEAPLSQNGGIISGGIDPSLMPKPQQSKNKMKYIIAGILLALAVVGASAYFIVKGGDEISPVNNAEQSPPTPSEVQKQPANPGNEKDNERKSDINDLNAVLKSRSSRKATYPMLNEINNPAFRNEDNSLSALDESTLTDPDSNQAVLVAVPTKGAYSYEPTDRAGKPCSNAKTTSVSANGPFACTKYKITAILEDGSKYEVAGESPR